MRLLRIGPTRALKNPGPVMRRGPLVYAVVFGGIAVLAFLGGSLVRHKSGSASFRVSPGVYSNILRESADADLFVLRIEGRDEMKGMVCDRCAQRVHEALLEVAGVEAARVDLTTQEAGVLADTERVSADRLVQAVNDADFGAVVLNRPSS